MRRTPETDAFRDSQFTDRADEMDKLYDLAEKLERERDEAQERECAAIESWWEEHQRALREGQRVDEAREQNAKFRDIAERAIANLPIKCGGSFDEYQKNNSFVFKLRAELDQLNEGAK